MLHKCLCCCMALALVCFSANAQGNAPLPPEYMKHFRYYQLPGQPDSATFFKNMDSIHNRKLLYDSLLKQRMINPPVIRYMVIADITPMCKRNYNNRKFKRFVDTVQ